MELSLRLKKVASMVEKCTRIADIGTDHAYIPIYLIKNEICESAIATDINKGPVEKAKVNIYLENLSDRIECRLGGGFSTIKPSEVQCAIIAGMGGNLIRDIIEEGIDVFKSIDYCVLQPVQNPEVLREYIYKCGYKIIDEELCVEDNKFYEIMKIKFDRKPINLNPIYYEISKVLIDKKHPLLKEYISYKLEKYYKIKEYITGYTENSERKRAETIEKIKSLEGLLKR
ncbi:class I SAM-dependent methyltransferase [Clostridium sp. SYSU_GA19001]|uniref:tRNA (adenine(22)-N(1))-methyltransferase n=1 Tax=Clostridium caldaquaticum TaxID=2940653 RepID=UPI0020776640|nr:class I SAM-dependent methyltransferase [Clostridium caldaquaticum]MCM8710430.1 class I SAM-dependent methyltransferase [Clostridium caldaquaticum]